MYSQETGKKGGSGEPQYSDALAIKAIVPEKVQHDGKEKIAIVFNHRLNVQKSREPFFVEFVGTSGSVQVPATLANSSTLILEAPEYREPSVVTAKVYHGVHHRFLGQHRFEFLSRNDTFYRLLYGALDPILFMCEALGISPADVHDLDAALAETFRTKAPEGFEFLSIQQREGAGESEAEHPTLLHFACEYGLTELIRVLLHYPGAYEACSMKNCHNHWPYNIAENHGFDQLANELRAFHDQGDSSGYITMEQRNEEGVYLKMQKDDGSYLYVLKEVDHDIYTDVDGNNGNEDGEDGEYYVKMRKEDGGYYYVSMKGGVCKPVVTAATKQGYVNVPEKQSDSCNEENIYANLGQDDMSPGNIDDQGGQELYEDMAHDKSSGNIDDQGGQELYEDMAHDKSSGNVDEQGGQELYEDMAHDSTSHEQFYEDMNPEDADQPEGFYVEMQPAEQTPDSFGYVRPTSNQPVNRDAILFNRSASNAAAIRAKQIKDYERKTKSLPAAVDATKSIIEQRVTSGVITEREATEMMEKLGLSLPKEVKSIPRRGSTTSKSSTSTASSTGSSGISSSSEPEAMSYQGFMNVASDDEDIHLSRNDILSQLRNSRTVEEAAPPPLPEPDYDSKGTPIGRSHRPRNKTTPVDDKDIQALGLLHKGPAPPPPAPRVQRRQSSPLIGTSSASQSKESSEWGQPIPEMAQTPRTVPRPTRRPVPAPPTDRSRPAPPATSFERASAAIRHSGIQVLPPPPVQDSAPPQPARRTPMPQPRSPR